MGREALEMNRVVKILLILVITASAILRLYRIDTDLLFHYDQGLHALGIWNIWHDHHFVLLGHPTDVEGVFHGAFFYYFLAPVYALFRGDPVGVSMFMVILDVVGIFFLFKTAKKLFKSDLAGLIAAIIWGFSLLTISYSRWVSNVTPISFFAILFYFFLVKIEMEKKNYLWPLATLTAGIIIQLNGAIGFFFVPLMAVLFFRQRNYFLENKKIFSISVGTFLVPSIPLFLFDLRHSFLVTKSIVKMVFGTNGLGISSKVGDSLGVLSREIVNFFSYGNNLFTGVVIGSTVVGVILLLRKKEKGIRFLVLIFVIPLVGLLFYKRGTADFFYLGILPLVVLFTAGSFSYFIKKPMFILPAIIILFLFAKFNISNDLKFFSEPSHALIPIGTNSLITLEDRKKAVDFVYTKAEGKPFGLWIYTIPYFKDEPWDYVFLWYGQSKYGYLPSKSTERVMFDLWERDPDAGYRLDEWKKKAEKDLGVVVASDKYHDVNVEERIK